MRAATSKERQRHAPFCMSVTAVLMLSTESITKIKLKLVLIINIHIRIQIIYDPIIQKLYK